jgi:hypothetical protein
MRNQYLRSLFLFSLFAFFTACSSNNYTVANNPDPQPQPEEGFQETPTSHPLTPIINETSGIADSQTFPGHLWAHEDSGTPSQLYLVNHKGEVKKKIYLKGAINRDWEDMALSGNQLFIADIGDNSNGHPSYAIYQFPEPIAATDTIKTFQTIRFRYPNGSHDAEAFLIDKQTNDILIITKQENPSRIYKIAYPYNYTTIDTVRLVGNLTFTGVVSAALSPNGKEAILKTYTGLFYYQQTANEPLESWLQRKPVSLAYKIEPQGEAVTFANDNSGFFTLSEKGVSSAVNLYFYSRK